MHSFPCLHVPRDHAKDRMRLRSAGPDPPTMQAGVPALELIEQMLPFVRDLSRGRCDHDGSAHRPDLAGVERISAAFGLEQHRGQISVDCRARRGMRLEAEQLRMMTIASRLLAQYGACQQPLAPERHQTLRVEVFRMKRPEAHCALCFGREVAVMGAYREPVPCSYCDWCRAATVGAETQFRRLYWQGAYSGKGAMLTQDLRP